jgi:hypothetical protein
MAPRKPLRGNTLAGDTPTEGAAVSIVGNHKCFSRDCQFTPGFGVNLLLLCSKPLSGMTYRSFSGP